jgi:uncharacterized OsmC-like protein
MRFSHVASLRIPQRDSLNYAGSSPRWWSSRCSASPLDSSLSSTDDTQEAVDQTDQNVKALKHYHLKGTGKPSHVVLRRTDTGHKLATDVPRSMGREDRAAQPIVMLLAALAGGCTQATAVYNVGRHMIQPERVLVDRLDFDITAYCDEQRVDVSVRRAF